MTPRSIEKLRINRSPVIMFFIGLALFSCCFTHIFIRTHTHTDQQQPHTINLVQSPCQTAMVAACSFVYNHTAIAMINIKIVITITGAKTLCQASRMPRKLITVELWIQQQGQSSTSKGYLLKVTENSGPVAMQTQLLVHAVRTSMLKSTFL